MSSALEPIATGLLDGFAPLDRALRDPHAFRVLLRNLGWEKTFEDAVLSQPPLGDLAAAVAELVESGAGIVAALRSGSEDRDPLMDELFDVVEALQQLVAGLEDLDTGPLPASLSDPDFWAGLALDLPEFLFVRYVERYHPVLYGLLRLAGVIEDDPSALESEDPERPAYVRRVVVWEHLTALVTDPPAHLQRLYHWGDGQPFAHVRLLDELATCALLAGVRAERTDLRDTIAEGFYDGAGPPPDARELALPLVRARIDGAMSEQGVLLAPVPPAPGRPVDGLYLANLIRGEAAAGVALGPTWTLLATGDVDVTGAAGVRLAPGELTVEAPGFDGSAELAVEGTPEESWLLLGAPDGARLEVGGLRLGLSFAGGSEPEVAIEARTLPAGGRGGIAFVVDTADGDSFVRALITEPPRADLDLALRWSSRHGFTLGGDLGLAVTIPIEQPLGPLTLHAVHVALSAGDEGAALVLGLSASLAMGPFAVTATNVGLALEAVPGEPGGLVAGLGLHAGFKPPDAIGFTLDLEGASGGGFAGRDPVTGRWVGALDLQFLALGLGAVVVVDTQMPGDPDGWSLFCSVSATFPGIPLGFGFFLSGVGGIVCLNRTMDVEALAGGLKSGAANAILFPEDAVRDAATIVTGLDAWFPQAQDNAVLGIAARITWGTPEALVTGDVGVVLSFPELDFALLGSLAMELPDAEHPLLELHMDSLGTIDVAEQTVMVTASLYDSALLETIHLSGDMALYGRFSADPYFLLSVGGYHPHFQPPGDLPAVVCDLNRMRVEVAISEDVWYALEAYVAITSNTLQFGAEASFEASDRFFGVSYTARGAVGFDVLLVFSPFSFSAGFSASVAVTAGSGDKELFAVDLSARLEGPAPWYASGRARFEFFGLGVTLEIEVGGAAAVEAPDTVSVLDAVVAALADPSAWAAALPDGADAGAVLLAEQEPAEDGSLPVRPDAELEVRQSAVPLDRDLDRYGIYAIAGSRRLDLASAGVTGLPGVGWEPLTDWFAPSQYDAMTSAEQLGAPSYEAMTGGARFGTESVSFSLADADSRSIVPDYEVRILDEEKTRKLPVAGLAGSLRQATAGLVLETARRGPAPRSVRSEQFVAGPTSWSTADALTGVAVGTAGTYRAALGGLATAVAANPSARATLRVAPVHAQREAAA